MYQSGRAGDEAKKRKSPAKSGRVGITATSNSELNVHTNNPTNNAFPCKTLFSY